MIRMQTCEDLDQDLLLLEHDALGSGPRRWRVEAHLRRCPRCQERRENLGRVSILVAGAIREPDLPLWPPAAAQKGAPVKVTSRRPAAAAWPHQPAFAAAAAFGARGGALTARRPALVAVIALLATCAAVASILYQAGLLPPANRGAASTDNAEMRAMMHERQFSPAHIAANGGGDCASCHATPPGEAAGKASAKLP